MRIKTAILDDFIDSVGELLLTRSRLRGLLPSVDAVGYEDLSKRVKKTWWICLKRLTWRLLTRSAYRRFLLARSSSHAIFAVTLARILLAYQTGAMRYGLFLLEKRSCRKSGDAGGPHAAATRV